MSKKEITITKAAEKFIAHLESLSKSASTIGTVRRTLDLLIANLGEEKIVAKILPVHTGKFFKSEAATMQSGKDGMRPRAEASIKQIRRITRQFLIWTAEQGYVKKAPVPRDESERGGGVRVSTENEASDPEATEPE
jgi:hypothetical protein